MAVNDKKFKFQLPYFFSDPDISHIYSTDSFSLKGFKDLSIKFKIYLDGQLEYGWHSLMVEVHNNGRYNNVHNEQLKFWICGCKCTFNDTQISLPNIKYDTNCSDFGWVNFIESKNSDLRQILERKNYSYNIEDFEDFDIEFVASEFNASGITKQLNVLTKMYEDRKFTDVTFNIEGIEIAAHQSVLAAKSSEFEAIFNRMSLVNEIQNKTCKIDTNDIEPDVFEQFLKYIYTGTASINNKAIELFIAANKYQIEDLKNECAQLINNNITIDNCTKILLVADQLKIDSMETKAIEFINRNKNKVKVDDLFKKHPYLILKLYKTIKQNSSQMNVFSTSQMNVFSTSQMNVFSKKYCEVLCKEHRREHRTTSQLNSQVMQNKTTKLNGNNENKINTLTKLYEDKEFADVTFTVNGMEFRAHKNVLAMRSPVFQRMFTIDMIEKKTNRIDIVDMEQDVFKELLKYIYIGTASLDKYGFELIFAAERYDINDLKEECIQLINNNVTIDNCTKILLVADQLKIDSMETKAIEFINRNKVNVEQLFEQNPNLILKLYKTI